MADEPTAQTPPVAARPVITLSVDADGRETMQTNIPPTNRPLLLWLLECAKQMVLTQPPTEQPATLITPNGGMRAVLNAKPR